MRAEELLETLTDEELRNRANDLFHRSEAVFPGLWADKQRLLTEADFYLRALNWRQAERTAERDRMRNEQIAERDLKLALSSARMEKIVIALISVEIFLSLAFGGFGIYEGVKQSTALEHMDTSSAATADAMKAARDSLKSLSDAQAESLKILQQEQAQRAMKPRFALYVGSVPMGAVSMHTKPISPTSTQDIANFDLSLKNTGDVRASTLWLHAFVPKEIGFDADRFFVVPEPFAVGDFARQTLQVRSLPAHDSVPIHVQLIVPKGHAAFKIAFTIEATELGAEAPLGSLTVLPPNPLTERK